MTSFREIYNIIAHFLTETTINEHILMIIELFSFFFRQKIQKIVIFHVIFYILPVFYLKTRNLRLFHRKLAFFDIFTILTRVFP